MMPQSHVAVNIDQLDHATVKRLTIWYPARPETVVYRRDCVFNGERFLRELINYGWRPEPPRGGVIHLKHPAADKAAMALAAQADGMVQ